MARPCESLEPCSTPSKDRRV
ncbi:hypothetical protein F383_36077 [Gossypium arboreum]|uniref:Uncharacterized protein n=1 Tax=Gossypium arboreum TaxID=29729 RepID=A0A0B0PZI5_GOSAR|nr:hypothetical protein F383_36077 [Gossypium arboreum]